MELDPEPIPLDKILKLGKAGETIDESAIEDGSLAFTISHPGRFPPKDLLWEYDALLNKVIGDALDSGFTIDVSPSETCVVRNGLNQEHA